MAADAESALFSSRGDFIDGRFVAPCCADGEIALEDPGDLDALLGTFAFARDAVAHAVEAARRAWPAWRDAEPERRFEALRRLGRELAAEKDALSAVVARETGKPLWEAREEVDLLGAKIEITLSDGVALCRDRTIALGNDASATWRQQPRGVMAVLGPFNFPLHLPHGHVVPAVATGNTVVVKPSDRAPASAQLYAAIAARAGFPPGVFNLVQGDGDSGAILARHPDVDGVLFTGSYAVGRQLLAASLDHPRQILALEMGGKNGAVVCDDAELGSAAAEIAFGAAVTSGQRCTSTSRVIVMRSVADEFLGRLVRILGRVAIGHAFDENVFMGPVISRVALERHVEVIASARAQGAEVLLEGGPCAGPRRGHYVRPSVHRVARLDRSSAYQMEEHFIPDVSVLVADSFEEAVAALDTTEYGLAGAIFTADRARFEFALRNTRLGVLNWNASTVGASSRLPFGGAKRSGNDRPAGVASTLYCTYPAASIERSAPPRRSAPGFPSAS